MAFDTLSLLRGHPAFAHLDAQELAAVNAEMLAQTLPGGQALFAAGEDADALYMLQSGALGLFRTPHVGGAPHLAGLLSSGEMVGALSLLTRQPRLFTVRALRDSVVLRLSRDAFDALMQRHPRAMLNTVRVAMERLLPSGEGEPQIKPHSFAVLPFDQHVPVREFAERLRHALLIFGDCLLIDAALGRGRDEAWFAERESEVRFVLYVADGADADWRDLCRRQADALLLVVNADREVHHWPDHAQLDEHAALERPRHLLLLHPHGEILAGAARRWLDAFANQPRHHHVRDNNDVARVARLLARRSRGLVLSGGGARGFAAIGVVRALREAGVVFDAIGGTSIGAIIGAGVACEWDDAEIDAANRRAFVDTNPLGDWTLPLVALCRGARASRLLREAFATRAIEDLPLPFYCVSSNLTKGVAQVHRSGPLWLWLRASSAVPGILPPVLHHKQVFADGAIINNLPTDVMADDATAEIIACDINAAYIVDTLVEGAQLPGIWQQWRQRHMRPDLLSILSRAGTLNADASEAQRRALASRVFTPPLEDVGLLEWSAYDRLVTLGYRHACETLGIAARS